MNDSQQIWAVVLFYGAAQGVVVSAALLILKRGRRAANVLLSAVVFVTTIGVTSWFLAASGLLIRVPFMSYGLLYLGVAIGPLFYFYTQTLLRPNYKPRVYLVLLLALVPDLLRVLDLIRIGNGPESLASFAMAARDGTIHAFPRTPLIKPAVLTGYMLVFLFLSWRQIRRAEAASKDLYSNGARSHVVWLKVLNAGITLFAVTVVLYLLNLVIFGKWAIRMDYVETLVRCLIIQTASVAAFFLPEAFTRNLAEFTNGNGRHRAPLDDATAAKYLRALHEHMETDKPYRLEDLRLADVADKLSISPHVLSQLINERLQTNFSDFINRYRVEDTQALIEQTENDCYTLLAIARDCGFNSKTSFYRAFKKHVGMSPSEYRGRLRAAGGTASG
jgi:AraC-like DNA-binding protein